MPYIFSFAYVLSAAIYLALGIFVWRTRVMPASKPFGVIAILGAIWALCDAGYVLSNAQDGYLFWSTLKFIAVPFVPVALLIMAIRFYKRSRWWNWKVTYPMLVIPAISAFLCLTGNPLFRGNMWLDTSTVIPELHYHEGPYFVVHLAYTYGLSIAALLFIVASLRDMPHFYKRQTAVLLVSVLLPVGAEALRQLGFLPVHDPAPLTFSISGLLNAWAFSRLRVLDIAPVAHSLVIQNMPDLMLVIDEQERVVDLNPAASSVFKMHPDYAIGRPISIVFPQWRSFALPTRASESARCEVAVETGGEERIYDMSVSEIRAAKSDLTGHLLLLRDITNHSEAKEAYQRANTALRQQLSYVSDLQTRLLEQAIRDPLTGLFNRRYLEEALQYELALAEREARPLSLVMLDIDHFKQVNDTWGHATGDLVLQEISRQLASHVRETDIVCRFGGEEFIVVLPGVAADAAYERAELYRMACRSVYATEGKERISCTISLGVASFPDDGKTSQDLVRAADTALYSAKASGRNRTSKLSPNLLMKGSETVVLSGGDPGRTITTTHLATTGPM